MSESIVKEVDGFKYVESIGQGPTLMLLHGLFGALSNFKGILNEFGDEYHVVVPLLPIYELPLDQAGLDGLLNFTKDFVNKFGLHDIHVLGNSLGGHIALLYAIDSPANIKSLTLTGSSGLFESGMGDGYPRRGDYDYIKRKTAETFYDPNIATKELVDEVYNTVNDRNKAIRIVITAKSALQHNLSEEIGKIACRSLLVWGNQDSITPPFVGEKFNELLTDSELHFVDRCGHAPMMERPDEFNVILRNFLKSFK